MTLEPDEDEDPVRKCVACGFRPRWSRDARCRYCIECNPHSVRRSLKVRKDREGFPTAAEALAERRRQRQERYHTLRRAGMDWFHASRECASRMRTENALKQLALTGRATSASITPVLARSATAGSQALSESISPQSDRVSAAAGRHPGGPNRAQ